MSLICSELPSAPLIRSAQGSEDRASPPIDLRYCPVSDPGHDTHDAQPTILVKDSQIGEGFFNVKGSTSTGQCRGIHAPNSSLKLLHDIPPRHKETQLCSQDDMLVETPLTTAFAHQLQGANDLLYAGRPSSATSITSGSLFKHAPKRASQNKDVNVSIDPSMLTNGNVSPHHEEHNTQEMPRGQKRSNEGHGTNIPPKKKRREHSGHEQTTKSPHWSPVKTRSHGHHSKRKSTIEDRGSSLSRASPVTSLAESTPRTEPTNSQTLKGKRKGAKGSKGGAKGTKKNISRPSRKSR